MRFLLALAAMAALGTSLASAQFELIGTAPNQGFVPVASSTDGTVIVGRFLTPFVPEVAAVWTPQDGVTRLDPQLAEAHYVTGVSADGAMVVGRRQITLGGAERFAVLWDRSSGQRVDLGVLPGDVSSNARGISGDGRVIFGGSYDASGNVHAFRWDAVNGMQPLVSFASGNSLVNGVSFDGSVMVGWSHDASFVSRAFIWEASTGMRLIPGLSSYPSYAIATSDDGQGVLFSTLDSFWASGLVVYRQGAGLIDVDVIGGRYNSTQPVGITADGSTVFGSAYYPGTVRTSFVWRTSGVTILDPTWKPVLVSMSGDGELGAGYEVNAGASRRPASWTPAVGVTTLAAPAPGFSFAQASVVAKDGSAIFGSDPSGDGLRWQTDSTIGDTYCEATAPNSAGQLAELALSGTNQTLAGTLVLTASGVPAGNFGFFLVSSSPGFVTPVVNSQGALCLGGGIGRFIGPGQAQQANSAGLMGLTVDPGSLPSPNGFFAPSYGQSLYFQAWYRDANPSVTSNFTSAATVRFF